ncbi:MAG: hypothetical protein ACRDJO_07120 [Actinomycetota bacterium]
MELYCGERPGTCTACGGAIVTGDVVVPAERGWVLCLHCGSGLLMGRRLQSRDGRAPNPGRGTVGQADRRVGAVQGRSEEHGLWRKGVAEG